MKDIDLPPSSWINTSYRGAREIHKLLWLLGVKGTIQFIIARLFNHQLISVSVRGSGHPVLLRPADSDIFCLWQIYAMGDLELPPECRPLYILDAGAYAGYSSSFLAQRYPHSRLLAIEPDCENYEMLVENCKNYPNVTTIHAALWESDEPLEVCAPSKYSWEKTVKRQAQSSSVSVAGISIVHLLEQYAFPCIDLLKMDIEGAEIEVFSNGAEAWIEKIGFILIELHGDKAHAALEHAIENRGFSVTPHGDKYLVSRIRAGRNH